MLLWFSLDFFLLRLQRLSNIFQWYKRRDPQGRALHSINVRFCCHSMLLQMLYLAYSRVLSEGRLKYIWYPDPWSTKFVCDRQKYHLVYVFSSFLHDLGPVWQMERPSTMRVSERKSRTLDDKSRITNRQTNGTRFLRNNRVCYREIRLWNAWIVKVDAEQFKRWDWDSPNKENASNRPNLLSPRFDGRIRADIPLWSERMTMSDTITLNFTILYDHLQDYYEQKTFFLYIVPGSQYSAIRICSIKHFLSSSHQILFYWFLEQWTFMNSDWCSEFLRSCR